MLFVEICKAIILGAVQGVTEWLPISSTGHMIIVNEFIKLGVSKGAWELFEVVTQLGSIFAVLILFFDKINPIKKTHGRVFLDKNAISIWKNVIIAIIPAAVIGLLLDDFINRHFFNFITVAVALIVYGIFFIIVEKINKKRKFKYNDVLDLNKRTSFKIGFFQILALIPGTSRSGSTIVGASLLGVSRSAAAEFSFFLAIPVMVGATGLKSLKAIFLDGISLSATEMLLIFVATISAFFVSLVAIKLLMNFIKRHTFAPFGWYRIVLGIILLVYYFIIK